jgi:putative FmdB family regulatory protein
MPLYEYECDACGHRFEKIQKFSDPIVDTCPICGGAVRKLMSSPAIQFKGSGFYITDYGKKDQRGEKADSGSADKAAKTESSAGKGTDDKSGKSEKSEKGAPAASSDKAAGSSSTGSTSSDSTGGATKTKS